MNREVRRITTDGGCCSKKQVFLRLNFPFHIKYLHYFLSLGYKEKKSYTAAGLVYLESKDFIAIGPLGGNQLRVKCKTPDCPTSLDSFESIIKEMKDEFPAKIPEKEESKAIDHEKAG